LHQLFISLGRKKITRLLLPDANTHRSSRVPGTYIHETRQQNRWGLQAGSRTTAFAYPLRLALQLRLTEIKIHSRIFFLATGVVGFGKMGARAPKFLQTT
jgi:hypothetical protein